ncbi:MAG TPA: DUF5723 family protein [Bacteroidia bacterium]|jgi:hypothetical protein|nr:DUF5723 family protein [Bacteroidia bacterium]
MKRIFFLLFTVTGIQLSYAQDPQVFAYKPVWPDPSAGLLHSFGISAEYSAASDGLSNAFLQHFYTGGFIDSSEKQREEAHLLPTNRFGAYSGLSVAYSWKNKADTIRWEFTLAYRDRQSIFGSFTNDAFKLAFEGNRPFLGSTADISGTKMTLLHWQQMQFEAKYFSADMRSEMVFGVSFLNGQQFQEANIRTGKLFTQSDGTMLDATVDASYYSSDTLTKGFGSRNGAGNCFNFRFSTILGDTAARFHSQLMFSVQDLGYIRWNPHSQIYSVDTSTQFRGVDASDIVLNPDNISGIPSSDSLIGEPKNGQVISFLPIGIRARYILLTPFQWWAGVEARIWSYTGASTQYTMFGGWRTKDFKWSFSGGASYGGFGVLQFPLQVSYSPCKNFAMSLGTLNAGGYIVPKKMHGEGMFTNLSFAF